MPKLNYEQYSEIFKALGHPLRLQMALGLYEKECNVNKIVQQLKLPQSTVSQQLGVLRSKGIISPRKDGVRTCYQVVDETAIKVLEAIKK